MMRTTLLRLSLTSRQWRSIHCTNALRRDFKLADIGEGIVQVEVLKWFVKPGDQVKEFDKLLEVQSDKATVEITSRFAGRVKSLAMKEGEIAKVGQVLVVFDDESGKSETKNQQPTHIPDAPATTLDHLKEVEADTSNAQNQIVEKDLEASNEKILTTPAVRHLARENKIDLRKVKGSGKDGRIMKDDILSFIQNKSDSGSTQSSTLTQESPKEKTVGGSTSGEAARVTVYNKGEVKRVPITGIRREMVKTMTASLRIPHLGYMEDVRVDDALKLIAGKKDVTLLSVLIKATSMALVSYPELNSHCDPDATELSLFSDHNLGIAMDTPKGLMVPVIKDIRSRSVLDIAKELQRLKELGTSGKLGLSDLQGATFSLSNIGSVGGTYACPVIVPPQVAIGAFGRAKRVPMFENATSTVVKEARIMPVSWSADHRVIDGATIARFCNEFKSLVENPHEMLLKMI